ncbi:hypothetical protein BV25DRAFT_1127332 [Artomyces pyxidatus]|uniref:Uncharacterized protein n=1 Tax=Artomyces pyxidatus TaxID=48021 RepID=A0ACB8SU36_9AGAM|nr:hypothetical protein BV25DRAFT_1127332 [Artomyces pyxidatus]
MDTVRSNCDRWPHRYPKHLSFAGSDNLSLALFTGVFVVVLHHSDRAAVRSNNQQIVNHMARVPLSAATLTQQHPAFTLDRTSTSTEFIDCKPTRAMLHLTSVYFYTPLLHKERHVLHATDFNALVRYGHGSCATSASQPYQPFPSPEQGPRSCRQSGNAWLRLR